MNHSYKHFHNRICNIIFETFSITVYSSNIYLFIITSFSRFLPIVIEKTWKERQGCSKKGISMLCTRSAEKYDCSITEQCHYYRHATLKHELWSTYLPSILDGCKTRINVLSIILMCVLTGNFLHQIYLPRLHVMQ